MPRAVPRCRERVPEPGPPAALERFDDLAGVALQPRSEPFESAGD